MASPSNRSVPKARSAQELPQPFRRPDRRSRRKKVQRKIKLKNKHIVFTFLVTAGIFFGIHKTYVFLISWDRLQIRRIDVQCAKPGLAEDVRNFLAGRNMGNLLLCDINRLQDMLSAYRWIRNVRVRKTLPPALNITIEDRQPKAILSTDSGVLIDEDGVLLRPVTRTDRPDLPRLIGVRESDRDYLPKLNCAWECLESLAPEDRERVDQIDLSFAGNLRVRMKDSPTWLLLGQGQYAEKLESYRQYAADLGLYAPFEYVDLRFRDRFYAKPLGLSFQATIPSTDKEAN